MSVSGNTVAAASSDFLTFIKDFRTIDTGAFLRSSGHCVALNRDGTHMATASEKGAVHV
jgi:hypothetical protein